MDYVSEACTHEYTNVLYCGANLPASRPTQNTLYAINTITGARIWGVSAGSIRSRPQLDFTGRLYAATYEGAVTVRATDNGAEVYKFNVTDTYNLVRKPWPESRNEGGYRNKITLIDTNGTLYAFTRSEASASLA